MKVFLSYRREDSPAVVDRVVERLRRKLGPGNVFKDVDSVSVGENFLDKIQTALTAADVLLVVIGPGWLNASKRSGKRRLDDPDDWVRIEVREALQRDDVRVVPLLVEGATIPRESDLPPGLKALAYRQAFILRPDPVLVEADLDTLCERLDPKPEAESEASAPRAVDIPQVTAAGGGIQQAHTAGSPGLRRPVVFVLAAAGLAILAIALLIASRVNPASPTPPEQTGTPKIPAKPVTDSGTTVPSPSREGRDEWRWCGKCEGLFFGANVASSHCPAGGGHILKGSGNYVLTQNDDSAPGQDNWRWCNKCQGLWFAGHGPARPAPCPAGGGHVKIGSGNYKLVQE